MVKLVECWDFPYFEDLIQRRTERIVADYRGASERARQALAGRIVRIEDPPMPSLNATEKSIELPAPAQRTWKDWPDAADKPLSVGCERLFDSIRPPRSRIRRCVCA